ncbi:MAG TPA: hypothetical protein VK470_09425 [Bacteroidota bacterium]|nr:hypothetical protein [Bacteroidota bacterium]
MKTFSVLLCAAGMVFVLNCCTDLSQPIGSPNEQARTTALAPNSLAKKGPAVNWASGNAGGTFDGKSVTWAGSARMFADGSSDGQYELNVHSQDMARWHGNVVSLKVYDGNTAVIGGKEVRQEGAIPDAYEVFIWVDGGEGVKAPADRFSFVIYWTQDRADAERVWSLKPADVIKELERITGMTEDEIMLPVAHGNISVR